jgi:succinoglycan biosynthesis protein ExoA
MLPMQIQPLSENAPGETPGDKNLPFVSIVVPCRNESASITRAFSSILVQDYPHDRMEVLIVDGMSEDATLDMVRRTAEDFGNARGACRLVLLENPQRIVPAALNLALKHAKGDIIFRLDGHSEMSPGYINACVARLRREANVACVGGPSIAIGKGLIGGAYALALSSFFGVGGKTFRTLRSESYVDTVAFGGYNRCIFNQIGGFDPRLERNQDIDFNTRLRKAGYRQLLIPDVCTYYHAPGNWRKIISQNYMNGYWNTKALSKMLGTLSWRHFIPLMFVLLIMVLAAGASISNWALYLLVAIMALYGTGAGVASIMAAFQSLCGSAFLLPLIFPVMHVSYGLGSLVGLIRFLFSRRLSSAR